MTKRTYLVSFIVAFVLALGLTSVAFADEASDQAASNGVASAAANESTSTSKSDTLTKAATTLKIQDFNGTDPRNSVIELGQRLNVRVVGAANDQITWTSLDPDKIKVLPGSEGGFSSNSECTLVATGYGWGNVRVQCGDAQLDFKIRVDQPDPVDITKGYAWTAPNNCTYTGKPLTPVVTIIGPTFEVTSEGLVQGYGKLKVGVDYKVTFTNNVQVGTAKVTVEGIGLYTGKKTFEFRIDPAPSTGDNTGGNSGNSGSSGGNDDIINVGPNTPTNVNDAKPKPAPQASAVTGTWKKSHGKWWFSYDSKSAAAQGKKWPANEWVTIKGKRYHFNGSGYMNSGWYKSGNFWYYLGSDGAMRTGWQKVKGTWYYLGSNGIMLTGKLSIGGTTYFLNPSNGAMKTGWNNESNTWYYYKSSGAMATGWQKVKGKWYFLDRSTGAMKTGWLDDGGARYYLNGSGAMLTGWKQIGGKWYYFSKSGVMQHGKWIGNYYVGSDGVMATNTWIGKYHVNGSGKWDKTR